MATIDTVQGGTGIKNKPVIKKGKGPINLPGGEISTNEAFLAEQSGSIIGEFPGELVIHYTSENEINVNAPGIAYEDIRPFQWIEHCKTMMPKSPLQHTYIRERVSQWFRERAKPGDDFIVDLQTGHTIVRSKDGTYYTYGTCGTMRDS